MKLNDRHLAYYAKNYLVDPDKDGWLLKKGELNTSYQKRWCVLKDNLFFYFEKKLSYKSEQEAIGVIVLENSCVQLAECRDSQFTFSIQFPGEGTRTYKFSAESEHSCNEWIRALTVCTYRYWNVLSEDLERKLYDDATCSKINDRMNPTNHPTTSNLPCASEVSASQTSTFDHFLRREGVEETLPESFPRPGHSLPTSNCSTTFIALHNEYWKEIHQFIANANS